MKTSFIELRSTDCIAMHGVLFEPDIKSNMIVIHHHGMEGNFYENTFIRFMAETYTNAGIAFMSYNNRGHDYICDLKMDTLAGVKSIKGGTAFEKIADNVMDVEGAVKFCESKGYEKIILQGHSSGANKIVYAIAEKKMKIYATILLSPCDDFGLYTSEMAAEDIDKYRQLAREMVNEGRGEEFMPKKAYMGTLLCARTFLECSTENSAIDVFPYRDETNPFTYFSKITTPIFVSFGTEGDYLLQEFDYAEKLLNSKKADGVEITFNLIEGAAHNYRNHEQELSDKIVKWILGLKEKNNHKERG